MRHPEIDFRKDHYWHIRNFNASSRLPRSTFSHAVNRVREAKTLSYIPGNWGKEVHYQLADKFCSGREGHCFGMSVAAVKAWHEKGNTSSARIPAELTRVQELNPKIKEEILALHLKQLELDYLSYVLRLFSKRQLFASPRALEHIVEIIDREGCALVNVVDVKKLSGHTVVAYDYRKDRTNGDYIIYIADSNHPWMPGEGEHSSRSSRHPSYIRLLTHGDGRKKAGLYYRNRCEGRYDVVFGVPYQYIR
ncbi:MAG: hypothetical protein MJ097_02635 [Dorea sp.]|nr:hypothetical protein [Dorea sp.]